MISAGDRFNYLTVIDPCVRMDKYSNRYALFRCDCGNEKTMLAHPVKNGKVKSCGCFKAKFDKQKLVTHGQSNDPIYSVWEGMKARCQNPNSISYPNYGGRGIKVCERWQSFENFAADMGPRPDFAEIDRIDNDGPYSPENCRWVTKAGNANNRRTTRLIEFNGETKSVSEWAKHLGIQVSTLDYRLKNMSVEVAFQKGRLYGRKRTKNR